jgi:hypothetical protein
MLARAGVLETLILPVVMLAMVGPTRFGLLAAYAAGLVAGQ